jgi:glycine cleavage system H protein
MLSPVSGDVVAVNKDIVKNPDLINQDPYGKGWLMMVKPDNKRATVKNLLTGKVATAWMDKTADELREKMGGELGDVYQDGGLPVSGIAKALSPDAWDKIASEFLLTHE